MAQHGPFVEGSVEPLEVLVEADGVPVDLDLYGAITPILTDSQAVAMQQPGTCVKVSPQTGANKGKAIYTPHASSYTVSAGLLPNEHEKLRFRLSILDGNNVPQFFPAGVADTILVYRR